MTSFSYDILVLTKGKLTDEFDRAVLTKIKTSEKISEIANRNGITVNEVAAKILNSRREQESFFVLNEPIKAEHIKNISTATDSATRIRVRNHELGCDYYIHPDGASIISINRHDMNTDEIYASLFKVPSNILNMDCDGKAIRQLFAQIVEEYNSTKAVRRLFAQTVKEYDAAADVVTWHDTITMIPNKFMQAYGVEMLPEPDIMLDLTVNANEPVIQEL